MKVKKSSMTHLLSIYYLYIIYLSIQAESGTVDEGKEEFHDASTEDDLGLDIKPDKPRRVQ